MMMMMMMMIMIMKCNSVKNTVNYEHGGSLFTNLDHFLLLISCN